MVKAEHTLVPKKKPQKNTHNTQTKYVKNYEYYIIRYNKICIGNSFLWAQNLGGNKGFNRLHR